MRVRHTRAPSSSAGGGVDQVAIDALFMPPPSEEEPKSDESIASVPDAEEPPAAEATASEPEATAVDASVDEVAEVVSDETAADERGRDASDESLEATLDPPEADSPETAPSTPAEQTPAAAADADAPVRAIIPGEDIDALMASIDEAEAPEPAADTPSEPATDVPIQDEARLTATSDEDRLDEKDDDASLVNADAPDEDFSLSEDSIDSLLSSLDNAQRPESSAESAPVSETASPSEPAATGVPATEQPPATKATAPSPDAEEAPPEVSDDVLNSLMQLSTDEDESPDVAKENLAAAATASQPESAQAGGKDIDSLIKHTEEEVRAGRPKDTRASEDDTAPVETATPPGKSRLHLDEIKGLVRIAASLMAGTAVGLATYFTLSSNAMRTPPMERIEIAVSGDLDTAMAQARKLMDDGAYADAAAALEAPIQRAEPSRRRSDAAYLRIEALYRGFRYEPGSPDYFRLHALIDDAVDDAPTHPRAPEALYWKAQLYLQDRMPLAAREALDIIIENYTGLTAMDEVLMEAAQLAMDVNDPAAAAQYAQRLLRELPASPLAPDARLTLADAYALAGLETEARTLYVRAAQTYVNTPAGNEALIRLAQLAADQGEHTEAIRLLEQHLERTTTVKGTDEVRLMLAKSYRRVGQLEDARRELNDIVNFLPESKSTPEVFIELSQVNEALGDRRRAVRLAEQAVERFPENPDVLRNNGMLQALAGNAHAAGTAYVEADKAGANDPELLLLAGRYFRTAGRYEEAKNAFQRLRYGYARSPLAITAGIEDAELLYEQGRPAAAIAQLEDLAKTVEDAARRLPILRSMSGIYADLGLKEKSAELAKTVAAAADDPEVRATAAKQLAESGELDAAAQVLASLDLNLLEDETAYDLLMTQGQALLAVDPRRGLDLLEQAYFNYPDVRSFDDEKRLLDAYLLADRRAAARRLVSELAAHVRANPVDAPHLVDAATAWGDYLYKNEDFRAAATAYGMALETPRGATQPVRGTWANPEWARYQRANALLETQNYAESAALFDAIAKSDTPWSSEARVKAEVAKLELRRRGYPVDETVPADS